jgi:hypothetical protein
MSLVRMWDEALREGRAWITPKRGAVTVSMLPAAVATYDAAGRPVGVFLGGRTYRRGLDNRVLCKWGSPPCAVPDRVRFRREVAGAERAALLDSLAALAARAVAGVRAGTARLLGSGPALPYLERAVRWDARALEADGARLKTLYPNRVSILPPDQYQAVVLQLTIGCPYNRCIFCSFYRSRRFSVRPEAAFREHVRLVKAFLGDSLLLRRSLFLGDANVLNLPVRILRPAFDALHQEFPDLQARDGGAGPRGIYAFMDAFTGSLKPVGGFAALAAAGLRRVYVGVETGHDPLLRFLEKPATAARTLETVRRLKGAGVSVGAIVMVGAGGDRYAAGHLADTLALLRRLALGPGDILYLSEFVEEPGSVYRERARAEGIQPLSPEAVRAQAHALREGLPRVWPEGPKVARYDIREFLY